MIRLTIPGRLIPHGELLRMHWAKRARIKTDLVRIQQDLDHDEPRLEIDVEELELIAGRREK